MAKALFGFLGPDQGPEPSQGALVRAKMHALEMELARLRAENDRLASAAEAELLSLPQHQVAHTQGRGAVALATGSSMNPTGREGSAGSGGSRGSHGEVPSKYQTDDQSADRLGRLEDSLLHLGSMVQRFLESQVPAQDAIRPEPESTNQDTDAAPETDVVNIIDLLTTSPPTRKSSLVMRAAVFLGIGSLSDITGQVTFDELLASSYRARGFDDTDDATEWLIDSRIGEV